MVRSYAVSGLASQFLVSVLAGNPDVLEAVIARFIMYKVRYICLLFCLQH